MTCANNCAVPGCPKNPWEVNTLGVLGWAPRKGLLQGIETGWPVLSGKSSSPSGPLPRPSRSQASQVFRVDFPSLRPPPPASSSPSLLLAPAAAPFLASLPPGARITPPPPPSPQLLHTRSQLKARQCRPTAFKIKAMACHPRPGFIAATSHLLSALPTAHQGFRSFTASQSPSTRASNSGRPGPNLSPQCTHPKVSSSFGSVNGPTCQLVGAPPSGQPRTTGLTP